MKNSNSEMQNIIALMYGVEMSWINHGHLEGGRLGSAKKLKTPFFEDIKNSFHQVTHIGPEPHQFFSF